MKVVYSYHRQLCPYAWRTSHPSLKALTDMEKSKTFLMSSGCETAPMVLINRTFSSCKSASLNSFIMASSVAASPCLRTVPYTAERKSAGTVDSSLQWAWNLFLASATMSWRPNLPRQAIISPRRRASRCPNRAKQIRIPTYQLLLHIFAVKSCDFA